MLLKQKNINWKLWGLILIIIIYIVRYTSYVLVDERCCVMDSIRLLLHAKCVGIIVIFAALYEAYGINKNSYMTILLIGSKEKYLFAQIKKCLLLSAEITFISIITATIVGVAGCGNNWINWMELDSKYATADWYQGYNTTLLVSFIYGTVVLFMQILVTLFMVLFDYWVRNSCTLSVVFIVMLVVADRGFKNIFYDRFTIKTYMWSNPTIKVVLNICVLIGICCVLLIAMIHRAKRKDFINENNHT